MNYEDIPRVTNDQWHLGPKWDTRYHCIEEWVGIFDTPELTLPCLYQYLPTGGIAEKIADNQYMMHTELGHPIVTARGNITRYFTNVICPGGDSDRNGCDCDLCISDKPDVVKKEFPQ